MVTNDGKCALDNGNGCAPLRLPSSSQFASTYEVKIRGSGERKIFSFHLSSEVLVPRIPIPRFPACLFKLRREDKEVLLLTKLPGNEPQWFILPAPGQEQAWCQGHQEGRWRGGGWSSWEGMRKGTRRGRGGVERGGRCGGVGGGDPVGVEKGEAWTWAWTS